MKKIQRKEVLKIAGIEPESFILIKIENDEGFNITGRFERISAEEFCFISYRDKTILWKDYFRDSDTTNLWTFLEKTDDAVMNMCQSNRFNSLLNVANVDNDSIFATTVVEFNEIVPQLKTGNYLLFVERSPFGN